jgi:hypothetical protein
MQVNRQVNRKGIFQDLDAHANVLADERWQVLTLADGSIQIDNETVRVAPFDEPRSDSVTMILDNRLRLFQFSIHGLFGRRESRVCVLGEQRDEATLCWRFKDQIHERRVAWRDDIELDWNSPLFNMATIWRSKLQPGQSRQFDCYLLDAVTFEPKLMQQIYTHRGEEKHETRFGEMTLTHYELDFGADGQRISHIWCDEDGVIYDFISPEGSFKLTATNL